MAQWLHLFEEEVVVCPLWLKLARTLRSGSLCRIRAISDIFVNHHTNRTLEAHDGANRKRQHTNLIKPPSFVHFLKCHGFSQ